MVSVVEVAFFTTMPSSLCQESEARAESGHAVCRPGSSRAQRLQRRAILLTAGIDPTGKATKQEASRTAPASDL